MGSLDKSNQTSEDLELDRAPTSVGDETIVNPDVAHDEFIQFGSDKRFLSFASCSSSVSSDFSLDDPLQDLYNEQAVSSLQLEAVDQLTTLHEQKANEKTSVSGTPSSQSNLPPNDCIYESPPIQVMEHPETSKYRIPSHVFARKKSITPGDWGMPSNESLFSIHMGSNSFCNLDMLDLQSEELDLDYGVEASISNSQHENQFINDNTTEEGKSSELDEMGKSNELSEVNNQGSSMPNDPSNSGEKEDRPITADARTSHSSEASSSSSSKSFVFPILAGETEKGGSPTRVPKEPKLGPAEPPSKPEVSETKAETKPATPFITWTKWFPCFRYCACC